MMRVLAVFACALLVAFGPEGARLPASVVSASVSSVSSESRSSAAAADAASAAAGRRPGRLASSARTPVAISAPAPVTYSAPLAPLRVVRRFDPPATRFGPGHLGVDLAAATGSSVRVAADGVVQFAGPVAGRGLVVVLHADGISTEYEPIRPVVSAGAVVARGEVLGLVHGTHGGCAVGRCLHWGARRGADYLDPLLLLEPIGPVRLLPWPR